MKCRAPGLVARHRVKGDARGRVILKALPLPAVTSELKLARQRLEEEVRLASALRRKRPVQPRVPGSVERGSLRA